MPQRCIDCKFYVSDAIVLICNNEVSSMPLCMYRKPLYRKTKTRFNKCPCYKEKETKK